VYAPRRGWSHASTKDFGRVSHYMCLVILLRLYFFPTFVIVFVYFATIVHQECRVERSKHVMVQTRQGWQLLRDGAA
jgi:hypothetical protein